MVCAKMSKSLSSRVACRLFFLPLMRLAERSCRIRRTARAGLGFHIFTASFQVSISHEWTLGHGARSNAELISLKNQQSFSSFGNHKKEADKLALL